ncbi:MAG: hypothetical protein E7422_00320 [Ruminococcaceae bacterium]|nr:hypothetical protein [Oscillospiraceae bacterium]
MISFSYVLFIFFETVSLFLIPPQARQNRDATRQYHTMERRAERNAHGVVSDAPAGFAPRRLLRGAAFPSTEV